MNRRDRMRLEKQQSKVLYGRLHVLNTPHMGEICLTFNAY